MGRAINIYATNALRATGEVTYPFYVGFVVQWSVAEGCGFLFGIHWGWGLVGMWSAFVLDENLRGIIFVQRWKMCIRDRSGDIALNLNDVNKASSDYNQAIYLDEDCSEAYFKYAQVYKGCLLYTSRCV